MAVRSCFTTSSEAHTLHFGRTVVLVEGDVIRIVGSKSGRSLGQLWPCMLVSRTGTDSRPSHLGGSAPKRGTAIDSQGMTKKESHVALVVVIVVVVVVVVV